MIFRPDQQSTFLPFTTHPKTPWRHRHLKPETRAPFLCPSETLTSQGRCEPRLISRCHATSRLWRSPAELRHYHHPSSKLQLQTARRARRQSAFSVCLAPSALSLSAPKISSFNRLFPGVAKSPKPLGPCVRPFPPRAFSSPPRECRFLTGPSLRPAAFLAHSSGQFPKESAASLLIWAYRPPVGITSTFFPHSEGPRVRPAENVST